MTDVPVEAQSMDPDDAYFRALSLAADLVGFQEARPDLPTRSVLAFFVFRILEFSNAGSGLPEESKARHDIRYDADADRR